MDSVKYPLFAAAKTFRQEYVDENREIFDLIDAQEWEGVLERMQDQEVANRPKFGECSLDTPIHYAIYKRPSPTILRELASAGVFLTLKNAKGQTPYDLAKELGYDELAEVVKPVYHLTIPESHLQKLEENLHKVMRKRSSDLIDNQSIHLPQLGPLLEGISSFYFPVPGMYGGFNVTIEGEGTDAFVEASSWCRVVEGSEQTHKITAEGFTQISGYDE